MTKPREKTREELTAEIEDRKKKIRQFENREKMLLGFTQNSPKETGRNSQTRIKRKSHYSKPFKSFILNSDQTTQ